MCLQFYGKGLEHVTFTGLTENFESELGYEKRMWEKKVARGVRI